MHLSRSRLENMTWKERWVYLVRGYDAEKLRKFNLFHRNNPQIFEALEDKAVEQMDGGWVRSSVWLILNIIRSEPGSTFDPHSEFKISNDYFALYARMLIAKQPRFANWIEIERLKGQKALDYSDDSFGGR